MKDRAKAFALICFGLMCLVSTGQMLMGSRAEADINPAGSIFGMDSSIGGVLTNSGEVWIWSANTWNRRAYLDPPVPLAEIAMWGGTSFVTTTGDVWAYPVGSWINFGPPSDGVRIQDSSWSGVKSKFGND